MRSTRSMTPRAALALGFTFFVPLLVTCTPVAAPAASPPAPSDGAMAEVVALYTDLHEHPELSKQETRTAARLVEKYKALGFDVTTGIGGAGFVARLANGAGPTVMLRTELDALPIEEKTGLAYASHATATDEDGAKVGVMHACGHDVHMSIGYGAAAALARARGLWKGTLVIVGQPAEEELSGARAMLAAGIFTRFPKPNYALALHVDALEELLPGRVSWVHGAPVAGRAAVDVTIFGKGGGAAAPQKTVDPIVIASRVVLALQTIVARELDPRTPAVVTVGAIRGGEGRWSIPDEVKLALTVRALDDAVLTRILASVERIAKGEAAAAGAPKEPLVAVHDRLPPVVNDPAMLARVTAAMGRALGAASVVEGAPTLASSDDFAEFGHAGVPSVLVRLGSVDASAFAAAAAAKEPPPELHTATYAPDRGRTLRAGVTAAVAALVELMPR